MAGHSKWKNIQHRKGRQDAIRGKAFTKAAKEVIIAAKGGGDPDHNARLRAAIAAAKAVSLPKDKIEAAIRKGTGEEAGGDYLEVMYEGYGPGGIAVLVEAATDNRNRTVAEIRHTFLKSGGSMGESGCVAWMFDKKGVFVFDKEKYTEDQLMEVGLEAGAEDIADSGETWEVQTALEDYETVRQAFENAGFEASEMSLQMIPQNSIEVDAEVGRKVMNLIGNLEDNDDVQNVYANFDMSDDVLAQLDT